MYVVTVAFEIHAPHFSAFKQAVVENAQASLRDEPGCRQFDVCQFDAGQSLAAETKIFLYEVYNTADDFSQHLASPHFLQFNALTASWVAHKTVSILARTFP